MSGVGVSGQEVETERGHGGAGRGTLVKRSGRNGSCGLRVLFDCCVYQLAGEKRRGREEQEWPKTRKSGLCTVTQSLSPRTPPGIFLSAFYVHHGYAVDQSAPNTGTYICTEDWRGAKEGENDSDDWDWQGRSLHGMPAGLSVFALPLASLNPTLAIKEAIENQEIKQRGHEKLIVTDQRTPCGVFRRLALSVETNTPEGERSK